jgi:Predicted membrane protein (DUF2339)
MNDPLSDVESRVRDLEQSLRGMELRIARIEDHLVLAPAAVEPHVLARPSNTYDFVAVLSNIGRTFVALGGAYLLRALTDSGILPQRAGIAVGLAYAVAWLIAADRAGAAGRVVSSAFHGFVAALIAFPLLWEAVTRFKLVDPEWSAVLLGLVTALALTVAVRQRLQVLAWITILAALPTTIALISATEALLPFALFAIVLGVATLWLGYSLEWVWLRWPAALVANVTVIALIARVSSRSWPDRPTYVIAVQLFLLTGYLLSIVVRTLVRGRDVNRSRSCRRSPCWPPGSAAPCTWRKRRASARRRWR